MTGFGHTGTSLITRIPPLRRITIRAGGPTVSNQRLSARNGLAAGMLPCAQLLDKVSVNVAPVGIVRPAHAVKQQPEVVGNGFSRLVGLP